MSFYILNLLCILNWVYSGVSIDWLEEIDLEIDVSVKKMYNNYELQTIFLVWFEVKILNSWCKLSIYYKNTFIWGLDLGYKFWFCKYKLLHIGH